MEAQGGGRPVMVEEFQAPMGAHGPCPVLSGTCPPATEGTIWLSAVRAGGGWGSGVASWRPWVPSLPDSLGHPRPSVCVA